METTNIEVWNQHYLKPESKQSYPDECLVRLIRSLPGPDNALTSNHEASDPASSQKSSQDPQASQASLSGPTSETSNDSDSNSARPVYSKAKSGYALDFGCGSGRHIPLLLESGYQTTGCDSSINAVEHCKKTYSANFAVSRDHSIPSSGAKDGLYDVIVCWGVLHYMPPAQARRLLAVLSESLKPGGYLLGTFRKDSDTHFKYSAVSGSSIQLASEKQLQSLLSDQFSIYEYGFMERTVLGKLNQVIAHWFFRARKSVEATDRNI